MNLQREQQHVSLPSYLQACFINPCRKKPQTEFKPEEPLAFQGGLTNASASEDDAFRQLWLSDK